MDSKARQELEKNELAKYLSAVYEDWIKPNSSWLGYAVIGGLIVVAVIYGTVRVNTWNHQTAWKHYYAAQGSATAMDEWEHLANSTSSIVGVHARLALAQRQLDEGCSRLMTGDKAEAIAILERAVASFQQVQTAAREPSLLQQAGFGLGQAWESLSAARVGDDFAKAEAAYQMVAERWSESFLGRRAASQLTLLRQPETRMFLERMAARVVEVSDLDDFREGFSFDEPFEPGGTIDFGFFDEEPEEEEE
ncbi:MAG: hypothetical protein FWG73_03080 [Planctomycetaceae bacterium]|nr:hypothetical protein [Planctomycetaceae bacterium]